MSRADEVRDRYEAELAVAELEDEFVAAKEAGEATPEMKDRLREARREFRLRREGDAAAATSTIQTVSGIESPGTPGQEG